MHINPFIFRLQTFNQQLQSIIMIILNTDIYIFTQQVLGEEPHPPKKKHTYIPELFFHYLFLHILMSQLSCDKLCMKKYIPLV